MKLVHRAWQVEQPRPLVVEFHEPECFCRACAPDRLTIEDSGKLAIAGAIVGSVIAFAIDPAGAAHALASIFTGSW